MKSLKASLLACAAISVAINAPASASVDEYTVGAETSVRINLEICSAETQLAVRGDTGTDLDFIVTDPSGRTIHTDQALDDFLSIIIEKAGDGCETYAMQVANLGDQSNDFTVVVEPITAASTRIQKYVILPNQTQTVQFKACGTSAQLQVRGDGDTDLDFFVRNSDGATVHENIDLTDTTTASLDGLLNNCETFDMEVRNLGEVYNAFMVVVTPQGVSEPAFAGTAPSSSLATSGRGAVVQAESEGPGEYRANANATINVNLPVCTASRLEVRGDGDTDLDFTIRNAQGATVHNDIDYSDVTFTTLTPSGEGCETFSMEVANLGAVFNVFNVTLRDVNELGGPSGEGEYRINANSQTKFAIRVCDTTFVTARGDGDTDLDFTVTDEAGTQLHSNFDLSDVTQFELAPADGCANYQLSVSNLGPVFNVMTIAFGEDPLPAPPQTAARPPIAPPPIAIAPPSRAAPPRRRVGIGAGEYSVGGNTEVTVALPICGPVDMAVAGDGGTDLDFLVRAPNGAVAHSNYDFSDQTSASFAPNGSGCETFVMEISNLGDRANAFTVTLSGEVGDESDVAEAPSPPIEFVAPPPVFTTRPSAPPVPQSALSVPVDDISTDGENRNVFLINRTGETVTLLFWSNSAVLTWGEDRLGPITVLAAGDQWQVNMFDGSRACLFDFKATTESGREVALAAVNVCAESFIVFE